MHAHDPRERTSASLTALLFACGMSMSMSMSTADRALHPCLLRRSPLVRQAAAAWTISLLKIAGRLSSVRTFAPKVQKGLVSLLADPQVTQPPPPPQPLT